MDCLPTRSGDIDGQIDFKRENDGALYAGCVDDGGQVGFAEGKGEHGSGTVKRAAPPIGRDRAGGLVAEIATEESVVLRHSRITAGVGTQLPAPFPRNGSTAG